jgi:hypothetical protein
MKAILLAGLICTLVVSTARAGSIAVDVSGGQTGLVSGFGGLTLGWEFEVTEGITVDGLGFWDHQGNGFSFGQTFPVGLWEASTGTLLGSSVITSGSALKASAGAGGGWRVNAITPISLAPGLYRIGALMPEAGGNQIITDGAEVQTAGGINVVRYLRELGSATLAMPDRRMNFPDDVNFGPTFTFTAGPVTPSSAAVAPAAFKTASGPTAVNTLLRASGGPRTYQVQYARAALAELPTTAKITGLGFRLNTIATAGYPSSLVTWPNFEVTLAEATSPVAQMSSSFGANMRTPVRVKSGPFSIDANTFPAGSSPNEFGTFVVFDTPYIYQGGDLVMMLRHPGSDAASAAFLDGVSTSNSRYGIDFRAFGTNSTGSGNGFEGAATIVQFLYTELPGQSVVRDGTNLVIVGTGGAPAGSYQLMWSPDIGLPMSQWNPVTTDLLDGSGGFRYTNEINVNLPAQFFRMVMP